MRASERRRRLVAGLLAGAALLAGCGGSDGPSKADYVTQADRVCAEGNRALKPLTAQIARAQRGTDPDVVFREVADLTRRAAAAAQPYLDRLDAVAAPPEDRDALKTWIAEQRRQQSLLQTLSDAFAKRDEAAISTLAQRIDALNRKNDAFARKYGLSACAASAA